uniref:Uncharacterized protein n=1 Tax=Odontella aurita TaxID=265563 RepID=A0A7S4MQ13_9STRA|mmetsp:Transcript_28215/g.83146  ORF Transcript_28215/g.83146 Transcript_28215/m.83146 type:complete len:143 (+) Transcript_28215:192-620(+)
MVPSPLSAAPCPTFIPHIAENMITGTTLPEWSNLNWMLDELGLIRIESRDLKMGSGDEEVARRIHLSSGAGPSSSAGGSGNFHGRSAPRRCYVKTRSSLCVRGPYRLPPPARTSACLVSKSSNGPWSCVLPPNAPITSADVP